MDNLWYPFTAMQDWASHPQLSIERGEANYLIATDGKRYLDAIASLWTNVHGHNHPHLNSAIIEQVGRISHSTLLGLSNPLAEELASKLVSIAPEGLNHVFYSDSGSTAVEIALKQAYQYWQLTGHPKKTQFIHLDNAYHGDTLGAVAVGGIDLFHQTFGPLLLKTHSITCPNGYAVGRSQAEAEASSLTQLTTLLDTSAETIAALIVEPLVQGAGGILTHTPTYLKALSSLAKQYNVLLIVDEVATGFGRTGKMFACEHAKISPDLMCLAKGITGGYLPLAATLSTSRVYEAFLAPKDEGKTFFHGHTYTGNALACAAALANIEVFAKEDTLMNLPPKISLLHEQLSTLKHHPLVGDIRQQGLMVGVHLIRERANSPSIGHEVCMAAREHGVIIRNLGDVIVLMPPLSITQQEISMLVDTLKDSIDSVAP